MHADQRQCTAGDVNEETAKNHGFTSPKQMLNALGITSIEDPRPIYSYAFTPSMPSDLPLNADRAGSHIVARQKQAYTIWKDKPDSSIISAIKFLNSLPKEQQHIAESRITPPDLQSPELQAVHPVPLNRAGTRPIPRDLHAVREAGAAPPTRDKRWQLIGKKGEGFEPATFQLGEVWPDPAYQAVSPPKRNPRKSYRARE